MLELIESSSWDILQYNKGEMTIDIMKWHLRVVMVFIVAFTFTYRFEDSLNGWRDG